jgi:hypothetical protein
MARRFFAAGAVVVACVTVVAATAFAIGFIDSPTAGCRKIKGNTCAVSWYYLSVNASPNYMLFLRARLGPSAQTQKLVYHAQGFFQTSMYIPYDMIGDVIVPCGKAGSSPDPKPSASPPVPYGNTYSYTIDARDSAGLSAANYGTVVCPPK